MQLSEIERLILANQYEILAILNSNTEKSYLERKKRIEEGFSYEYGTLFQSIQENKMTEEEYVEVQEITTMYNDIQWSYENLSESDKNDINEKEIFFEGFDMSFETEQYSYAVFLLNSYVTCDKFLPRRSSDLNSHGPTLKKYRKMYSIWKAIPNRISKWLNKEQIKSIFA